MKQNRYVSFRRFLLSLVYSVRVNRTVKIGMQELFSSTYVGGWGTKCSKVPHLLS